MLRMDMSDSSSEVSFTVLYASSMIARKIFVKMKTKMMLYG
jgi:hypothetical protein